MNIKFKNVNFTLFSSYFIWFISVLCLLFQFLLQFSSGMMTNQLMDTFHLTAARAGFLAGSYYHIYVLLQTPAGFLTDRLGPKNLLSYGCIICCIGCLTFASAKSFLLAEVGRIMMGGGLSFAFVGMVFVTATVLPANVFSLMMGVAETFAIFGTLICELYLAVYLETIGWRTFIAISGLVALFLSLLSWYFLPGNKQQDNSEEVARQKLSLNEVFSQLGDLFLNPVAWANGIYAGFMFAILTTFHGLWAQPFLVEAYHLSEVTSAHYTSLMLLGALFGFPISGWIGGIIYETRYLLSASSLLNAILLFSVLSFTTMSHTVLAGILILIGFFTGPYILCYSIAHNIVPAGSKSTSIGFTNTLAVVTAPMMQPLVGYLLDVISGPKHHTVLDFQLALGVIPLCLLVGSILACFLPTAKKSVRT
ncbi:MAG: MFS transporter [Pseudomonadota bacterium]|nr:MFS transporter [Pseudomonadota bacterium]